MIIVFLWEEYKMWDDITIGEKTKYNSAVCISQYPEDLGVDLKKIDADISRNGDSYWISNAFLGIGMTISRDSEEGKKLTDLIKSGTERKINNMLEMIVCKNLTASKIRDFIKTSNEESFIAGKEASQEIIRYALGIRE